MSRLTTRGSVRLPLRKALEAWFTAHADHDFYTGVAGRLAYVRAPKKWPRPYAVLTILTAVPRDTLTERIDEVPLQIMVFADSSLEAEELASMASNLFGGRVISGDGLKDFEFSRGEDVPTLPDEDGVWGAGIQLTGLVETSQ
ncbi:MAG: DUF3168 domain-containing protein [Desulfovibrio sp.]